MKKIPGVAEVAPIVSTRRQVVVKNTNVNTTLYGVTESYATVRNMKAQYGNFITDDDVRLGSKVAVLGPTTSSNLF